MHCREIPLLVELPDFLLLGYHLRSFQTQSLQQWQSDSQPVQTNINNDKQQGWLLQTGHMSAFVKKFCTVPGASVPGAWSHPVQSPSNIWLLWVILSGCIKQVPKIWVAWALPLEWGMVDPLEACPSPHLLLCQIWLLYFKQYEHTYGASPK